MIDVLPLFLFLGFAIVGVFMATLVIIWVAVWRASRRGDAASKPPAPKPAAPKPAAGEWRLPTRRRLLVLVLIGSAGGAVVGGVLSVLAAQQTASPRPPGSGRLGASSGR
ncbi:MAG TPA: hypothetical protein VGM69_03905 [Chloroflexota bacterium]